MRKNPTVQDFHKELASHIEAENAEIVSNTIIEFLANNGYITISGSKIFASESILFASSTETEFQIKDDSLSETNHNSMKVGQGASIVGRNGGTIKQSKEGIIFSA